MVNAEKQTHAGRVNWEFEQMDEKGKRIEENLLHPRQLDFFGQSWSYYDEERYKYTSENRRGTTRKKERELER